MNKAILIGLLIVLIIATSMGTSSTDAFSVNQPDMADDESSSSSMEESSEEEQNYAGNQEKMLCNVIVRVIHDLYVQHDKSITEIRSYTAEDCKNLESEKLIDQCQTIVEQSSIKIHEHLTHGTKMSDICEKIDEINMMELAENSMSQCSQDGGDSCQCCKMHVEKRKARLRYIVKEMTKKRMCICEKSPHPQRCRKWIRHEEQCALRKIDKICPYLVCKHLGFCAMLSENERESEGDLMAIALLKQQLQLHMIKNICSEFGQYKEICNHVAASENSLRHTGMYIAMIRNDTKWIDVAIQEEIKSQKISASMNLCDLCNNTLESLKSSFLQALEMIRTTLKGTCEKCPEKDKCEQFFNDPINIVKNYLDSLQSSGFCTSAGFCSAASSIIYFPRDNNEKCAPCVQRFRTRFDAAAQIMNQFAVFSSGLCAKEDIPNCQQFIEEVSNESYAFINQFDIEGACQNMGFCETTTLSDLDKYESTFVQKGIEMCSQFGTFETLCQKVVQGRMDQTPPVTPQIATMDELFPSCEDTRDECPATNDKCQCCIYRVIQKKKCAKIRIAKFVGHMLELCQWCPAKTQCETYWKDKQAYWNKKIDQICPKKVCIRMGYCDRTESSALCAYVGPFKKACEQFFAKEY